MATYNSFSFAGHGLSERTGKFDPGATAQNTTENSLTRELNKEIKFNLDPSKLLIHYDENNFSDQDLAGNTYTAKCGVSTHINAGGGTGVEIFVPMKEKYIASDIALGRAIATLLSIPFRGVFSRDYNSGMKYLRQDGIALNGTDYYGEIRDAWNRGISLAILEVGFIDTSDLPKIKANTKELGYLIAKYIAENCGVTLVKPVTPTKSIYKVVVDEKSVGAFGELDNVKKQVELAITQNKNRIVITKV